MDSNLLRHRGSLQCATLTAILSAPIGGTAHFAKFREQVSEDLIECTSTGAAMVITARQRIVSCHTRAASYRTRRRPLAVGVIS